jgi:ribosomal protein S12
MADPIKTAKRMFDQFLSKADSISAESRKLETSASQAQVLTLMARIGAEGGKIGGKRRLQTMTAKQRKSAARKAARARWSKNKEEKSTN